MRWVLASGAVVLLLGLWLLFAPGRGGRDELRPEENDALTGPDAPSVSLESPREATVDKALPEREQAPVAALSPGQRPPVPRGRRTLEGRLILPAGTPVDEEVVVMATPDPWGDSVLPELADDGSFTLEVALDVESICIELEASYVCLPEPLTFGVEDELLVRPELGAKLVGKIDTNFGPEATRAFTAYLYPRATGFDDARKTRARANGEFTFWAVPSGEYTLEVFHPDAARWREPLSLAPGETREVLISLFENVVVEGRIQCPVEVDYTKYQLYLVVYGADGEPSTQELAETVDFEGRFRLHRLPPGPITLHAQGPSRGHVDLHAPAGTAIDDLVLPVAAPCLIAGRVQWADGTPYEEEDFEVMVVQRTRPANALEPIDPTAWDDNEVTIVGARFELQGFLPGGTYDLTLVGGHDGGTGVFGKLEGVPAPSTDVVFVVEKGARVTGRVLDASGEPLSTFLRVNGQLEARSEPDGTFTLLVPADAQTRLQAAEFGRVPSLPQELRLSPGEVLEGIELRLGGGSCSLRGRLFADGEPIAGWVTLADAPAQFGEWLMAPQVLTGLQSDEDGRFELDGLRAGTLHILGIAFDPPLWSDTERLSPADYRLFEAKEKLQFEEGVLTEIELHLEPTDIEWWR